MAITRSTNDTTVSTIRAILGAVAYRIGLRTAYWTSPERGIAGHAWPLTAAERKALDRGQALFDSAF